MHRLAQETCMTLLSPSAHAAFTAYFRIGKCTSFLACFTVFSDRSCFQVKANQHEPTPR